MSVPNYSFSLSNAKEQNRILLSVLVDDQHSLSLKFTPKQFERLANQLSGVYSQSGLHNVEIRPGVALLLSGQQITKLNEQIEESFDLLF